MNNRFSVLINSTRDWYVVYCGFDIMDKFCYKIATIIANTVIFSVLIKTEVLQISYS